MVINRGRTPLFLRIVHLFTNAAGKARQIRWHDQGRPVSGPPRSRPTTASQETCHSCRAKSPILGKRPAASTEVVLAERLNSALPRGVLERISLSSLIPVPVTGIQCDQVLGRERLTSRMRVIYGADAPWLGSCDRQRNEGAWWGVAFSQQAVCA